MSFSDLGLSEPILKAVADAGYSIPTPIQVRAIPKVLQGVDVLGCAQTGTGKTAGFTLPMIDVLQSGRARARMPRSLILEPTRELAAQVSENFDTYGKYCNLTKALLIGGVSFEDQSKIIDRGADVLIATPGRLLDHFERGGLLLRGVDILVIDEADRMLDMGFIPDVERIVKLTNPKRQTLFFSATMPKEVRRLADVFLDDPAEIEVAPPASPADTVEQSLSMVGGRDKGKALRSLLRTQEVKNALIFCNRKRDVDAVQKSLRKDGFDAAAMHGDLSQAHRMETLAKFKAGEIQLLVCSDVAARGLDVQGLSHVLLYDLPIHAEDYVHRIGRTGRAGKRGRSFSLATSSDKKFLDAIETLIGQEIPRFDAYSTDNAKPQSQPKADSEAVAAKDSDNQEASNEPAAPRKRRTRKPSAQKRDNNSSAEAAAEKGSAVEKTPTDAKQDSRREETPAPRQPCPNGNRKGRNRNRDQGYDDTPVIGMGDHMPAFLMRTREKVDQ